MENTKSTDSTCPALELLPDGTTVATTCRRWTVGEQPYVVSVRFAMGELDRKVAAGGGR